MAFLYDANHSGADLSALIRQAAILSLKRILLATGPEDSQRSWHGTTVSMTNFEEAFDAIRPSVSDQDRRRYEQLRTVFDIVR
jgi:SpoVK/Ycf46/Vps4 family AAA+-type ATPase